MRRSQAGLTLIELLVTLLIIALISSVVVVTAPQSPDEVRKEADRFAAKLQAAIETSITTGSLIGMEYTEIDYQFYQYERGVWVDAKSRFLQQSTFADDLSIEVIVPQRSRNNERNVRPRLSEEVRDPTIFFHPTGETTAFSANFKNRRGGVEVELDNTGVITMVFDE